MSRETRTANAIGDLNGANDAMPRKAITIGIAEILSARKVRLGVFRDCIAPSFVRLPTARIIRRTSPRPCFSATPTR